jgi:hypothetical protein
MSACTCIDISGWRVWHRHCNYSAFNGYRETPSNYSRMICLNCAANWRTKAQYVDRYGDASPAEVRSAGRRTMHGSDG